MMFRLMTLQQQDPLVLESGVLVSECGTNEFVSKGCTPHLPPTLTVILGVHLLENETVIRQLRGSLHVRCGSCRFRPPSSAYSLCDHSWRNASEILQHEGARRGQ